MPTTAAALADTGSYDHFVSPSKHSEIFDTPDFVELDSLIGAIYEGPTESPPWGKALDLIRSRLNAMHATLILRPPSDEESGVMVNAGSVSAPGVNSYEKRFFALDPFVRLPEGEVFTAEELIGSSWRRSTMYTEYLEPIGIRHLLGADIYTRDGIECRFRVTRSEAAQKFSAEDKALVKLLLPHLTRSIQLHARLDVLECERQLISGTVNRLLLGMITFSPNGDIVDINEEARRILAEKDGISAVGQTLCVDSRSEGRELQKMIKQAAAGNTADDGPSMAEAMSISRPSGRAKLGVLVRTIPIGRWSESPQRPAAAVFLRDPESSGVQPSRELVRRLFGLTRMEASLALLLTEGQTLDEAAETLGVRRNTARTHLRAVFCKTGVTRQTLLVRLLLNSVVALG